MSDSYSLAAEAEPVEDAIKKDKYIRSSSGFSSNNPLLFFSHIC